MTKILRFIYKTYLYTYLIFIPFKLQSLQINIRESQVQEENSIHL